ncbi:MAG: hypothetical protein Q8M07_02680 [Prosthecobacter sp.]|nr:hypothetical protein [Prosthecobacter sp.]
MATKRPKKAARAELELKQLIAAEAPADLRQIQAVIGKVQIAIADYLKSGAPLKITLNPVEILSAIEAAIREAEGHPSPWPDGADARTFFIHGLYDDLIQQPSNIFETKRFPDGTDRYLPISPATWKACLEKLRSQIVEAGLKLAKREAAKAKS